ncbi:hypothetical protein KVV02_005511 [Mortierella alpina]|uniref:Arrestin C-terminal-like domain-containing protein n=1 Tax=Mortierella alpina TaxID=64518 RepID=A0A9P8ACH5_MORAP|nr:hypothetical protein KVV02_005511 [Mortierella alpina]
MSLFTKTIGSFTLEIQHEHSVLVRGLQKPLFYGTVESPAKINARVILDADRDYKADTAEIFFTSSAGTWVDAVAESYGGDIVAGELTSEQVFAKRHWDIPVDRPTPGTVGKGKYSISVLVTIDPQLPSSSTHKRAFVKHQFRLQLLANSPANPQSRTICHSLDQDVWILNSSVPLADTIQEKATRALAEDCWKEQSLPVSLLLPSGSLIAGQVVPMTVRMSSFLKGSRFEKQEPMSINNVKFALVETRRIRDRNDANKTPNAVSEVLAVHLKDGWPKVHDPWERTVNVTLPPSPTLSMSLTSKYLDVEHELAMTMRFKAAGLFKRSEEYTMRVKVDIVAPRPVLTAPVPGYSSSSHAAFFGDTENLPAYV